MRISTDCSDAELVAASLSGDRTAFAFIVERYQRLLCSLAYSATGRLDVSEDIAQDTFITAWQKLAELREPSKLKSWLCGILRFKASHRHRRDLREPVYQADSIESELTLASEEHSIPSNAMKAEEQAILWHAISQVPEKYREPLILFYRENQSVENVAQALDLTESAVKQRLTRGRRLLQHKVMGFVEGALRQSAPTQAFTATVMASLATLPTSAKAAVAGTATLQAGLTSKSIGLFAFVAAFSGYISSIFSIRAALDQTRTRSERRMVIENTVVLIASSTGIFVVALLLYFATVRGWLYPELSTSITAAIFLGFVLWWPLKIVRFMQQERALRSLERARDPAAFSHPRDRIGSAASEFKTKATLFGIPLVHIRFSTPEEGAPPAFGWIAGGDRAIGILVAWGAWAVGFFSVGAVSFGVFSFGAVGFGLVGVGAVGVGVLAIGASAIGYYSVASTFALGWHAANCQVFAVAHWAATGSVAFAEHADDAVAHAALANPNLGLHFIIFCIGTSLLSIVPAALYAIEVRKRFGRRR